RSQDLIVETWEALIQLREQGLAREIGVSNFTHVDLNRLVDATGVAPALNQIELHRYFQQADMRRANAELGVRTQAWSPLAQNKCLADPVITDIADRYGKSPAQVVTRWHIELGNIVIPKSVTASRIRANFEVFDFALDDGDLAAIGELDAGTRLGPDPATFG
ncbi:aldo/keto reductase, partial [Demequina sp. NBRC 110052]|uniref:aldo/keto reductase n=1 Tax=Demequina sp. NBRC 110052 TaxID=1570341 RepID=UPI00190E6014